MKYLHNFDTIAEYEAVKDTLEMPYIVSIDETAGLQYNTDVIRVPQGSDGSGGGITIVDSIDELDTNAELGSLACVVEQGSIKESSFRDLYQPDASIIDQEAGVLTTPELLSSVSSVNVLAPEDSSIDIELVECMVYLVTRDFSMTNQTMAMVQIMPFQGVMAMTMTGSEDTMQQFILAEYSQDVNGYISNDDQVEAFNAVLANGMDWCYLGSPETGFVITEEQFATIDLFVKAVASVPSKAYVYLKKYNWEELYAKDFEKLAINIENVKISLEASVDTKADKIAVNAKADKMPIKYYSSVRGLEPNVYTTYTISSTGSATIKLASITDSYIYNEYIMEIKCTATPSVVDFKDSNSNTISIKWANDNIPIFEEGYTYIISIVNNLGVFAKFTNS